MLRFVAVPSEYFVGSAQLWKIAAHNKQCVSILSRSLGPTRMDSLRGSLDSYLIFFFNATCTLCITQGPCPIVLCFSYVLWSHIFLKYCTRLCAVYVYILFSGRCILREINIKYTSYRVVLKHISCYSIALQGDFIEVANSAVVGVAKKCVAYGFVDNLRP